MSFADCSREVKDKIVVIDENKRKFIVNNPLQANVRKIKFDGCLIKNQPNQLSCDYGLWCNEQKAYLIELKGKNITHACEQIIETLKFIKLNHGNELKKNMYLIAVIIPSANNVPNLKQTPKYISLKKQVNEIIIKEKQLEINIPG